MNNGEKTQSDSPSHLLGNEEGINVVDGSNKEQ